MDGGCKEVPFQEQPWNSLMSLIPQMSGDLGVKIRGLQCESRVQRESLIFPGDLRDPWSDGQFKRHLWMASVESENPEGSRELRFPGEPLWEVAESWGGKRKAMVIHKRKWSLPSMNQGFGAAGSLMLNSSVRTKS